MTTGRLAPTPSGRLHLGNACAFAACWLSARQAGGTVLLRIEDVDTTRARAELEMGIREDLTWLGLTWDRETPRQSSRSYAPWLEHLAPHTYFCTCTRRQLRDAGGVYPGTCRDAEHTNGKLRLRLPEGPVSFSDCRFGPQTVDPTAFGDPVLVRRDGVVSYTLAVVADDITDGVTEVVRGADLLSYTGVQIRLWELLGAAPPTWLHSPLILGPDERKLGKSHGSTALASLRQAGATPEDIWRTVLSWLGLEGFLRLEDAVEAFHPERGPRGPVTVEAPEPPRT